MQRDAIDRLNLRQLLLEPEMLSSIEPDVHLVGTLLSLNKVMPETTKATARQVVSAVVAEIEKRIAQRTRTAVSGALNRAARTHRPKARDIDWNRTIRANLSRYLPEHRTVVPERLVGFGHRQQIVARDIILAIDQSGSMASSVVYASVFGAVLASIRAVRTSVVVFDTSLVDLGHLGALGAVPGWPGTEAYPAQPMVTQMRAVLGLYQAAGGKYTEHVLARCGHSPRLERPKEFHAAVTEFLSRVG